MPDGALMGSKIRFASLDEGRTRIGSRDAFTARLSSHERQARAQATAGVSEEEYLRHCEAQVCAWDDREIEQIRGIVGETAHRADQLGICLALPEEVVLVKTTGREEGGASGYTRGATIFFQEGSVSAGLFVHELFHVSTRKVPILATRAYELLGFREIHEIPDDDPLRITNPDTLGLRYAIEVRHRGIARDVCPVLRGRWPYRGGSFFRYVEKKLMVLGEHEGRFAPQLSNGEPVLLRFEEVDGLYEKIGRNTNYDFHPEEISAIHVEMLFTGRTDLPDPHLIGRLHELLSEGDA